MVPPPPPPPPPPNRSPYILDIITSGGKRSGVPCGGLPGLGLNSDRPRGRISATPRARHDRGPGRGKNLPLAITQVQHYHTLGGPERFPPRHIDVHQGSGKEATSKG